MLSHLRIRDLAIIDSVEIELGPGLNVLSGETGAGKSIIVGALDLLLGSRASADIVRSGAESAEVEGIFSVLPPGVEAAIAEHGLGPVEAEEGLVVRRVVTSAGRSRAYLAGRLVTLAVLREVVGPLVDMTSQHAQYALLDAGNHRGLLDQFASNGERVAAYRREFAAWDAMRREIDTLEQAERDRAERAEYLRFQISELEKGDLREGEEDELSGKLKRLRNAENLRAACRRADERVGGSGSAALLVAAERELSAVADFDPELEALRARLESARIELEDVSFELSRYGDSVDIDPAALDQTENRDAELRALLRRFGPTSADAIARLDEFRTELDQLAGADDRLASLKSTADQQLAQLMELARGLTETRRHAATGLVERVEAELAELAMPRCAFQVRLEAREVVGPYGIDDVIFEVATNRGEPFKALHRAASGGELSRILLSIKSVLLACDPVPTSVFDEVDTGVGGAVAEIIGRKLGAAARGRQVVSITHLPQIAAFAEAHFVVSKGDDGDRTVTRVQAVAGEERLSEVARMLGGVQITERTREHAREMIRASSPAVAGTG